MSTRIDQVLEALAGLGPDYDTALARLRESGCRGEPGSARHCIIAEYLRSRGCGNVAVGPISREVLILSDDPLSPLYSAAEAVDLPEHLAQIGIKFDHFNFADLEVPRPDPVRA